MANVYLFGYLEDDYLGRLMMASEELTSRRARRAALRMVV